MIDISQNYYPDMMVIVILILALNFLELITFGNVTALNIK